MRGAVCIIAGLLCGLCSHAQIRQLATTDSGDQLYFTSPLGVRNAESLPYPKILHWSGDRGFEIFAQRTNQGNLGQGLSNPYQLSYPSVSGDGGVVAFLGDRDCYIAFKFGCLIPNPPQTTIARLGEEMQVDGRYQLSPNGRFALRSLIMSPGVAYTLIDLVAGTSADLPSVINVSDRGALTNDGRVVFSTPEGITHLWSPDSDRQFSNFSSNSDIVSADARFIIFTRFDSRNFTPTLRAIATETGAVTILPGNGRSASISGDGTFLTYLSPVDGITGLQLFVARPDASDVWQITSYPEGVREAVISGDGGIVFLVLESNRILRYDVNSGSMQELSPRVAYEYSNYVVGVRGSLVTIFGTGLSEGAAQATYPLPTALAGAHVEAGGVPLLIVSADPRTIVAQIPFEMKSGNKTPSLGAPDGPLVLVDPHLVVADFLPFWLNGQANGFALHDDLKRLVTVADPARPGEVINFILGGLGDVTPPLSSGVPVPVQPELRVARSFQVVLRGSRQEVLSMELVKAIMIPGTIGNYQVSVRVPDASLLTPDVNGYFYGSISFEPGDPVLGTFMIPFGQVPIKP